MEVDMCPVCYGTEIKNLCMGQAVLELRECINCSHVFQFSFPKDEDKSGIQLEYFGDEFAERQGPFFDLYENINARRTLRALKGRKRQRVLEIGPGSGRIMACLASLGHSVQGLDLSPAVAKHIAEQWGLSVHVESLDAHKRRVGSEYYDVIIMRHVLEHFSEPHEVLQATHSLLRSHGLLYVAVPNMQSWHRLFRGWVAYQPYHFHYFNSQSLCLALTKCGFRIACVQSYESLTGWANTLSHSLFPRRHDQRKSDCGNERAQLMRPALEFVRLLAGLGVWPVRLLQSSIGQGDELSVVAERLGGVAP